MSTPQFSSRRRVSAGPLAAAVVALVAIATVLIIASTLVGGDDRAQPAVANAAVDQSGLNQQLVSTVQQLSPKVVQIETSVGLGSGVVYDSKGDIVTNAHVVGSSKRFTVTLAAGDTHQARLVGTFPPDDLAVIRLDAVPDDFPAPATFGDSSSLDVGELVLAIGNPLGLRSSVTNGIISSLGRTVPEGEGNAVITSAIQTSAAINPGNSGGALVDLDGNVVGIPTLSALDPEFGGAQAPGIGFAIPSNTVKDIASQLVEHGRVVDSGRASLGIRIASMVNGDGVLVMSASSASPLRSGDVILSVAGQKTPTGQALTTILATQRPGQTVAVKVRRPDGATATEQVRLGQLPG